MNSSVLLVLSPNWLGDAVMALPALADVRRHAAGARVVVAARRAVAGLFRLAPCVDEVLELEWRGSLRQLQGLRGDVRRLRETGAGRAVLLPNSFASAWLAWRAGVPERWGYARDLRGWLLTRAVPPPTESLHQGRYYQHLVAACGVPAGPLEPVLSVPPATVDLARRLLHERGWDEAPLVAVAPGAAYGTAKRWLPAHFARVVTDLVSRRGAFCVLVGSPADAAATQEVRALVTADAQARVADLAGATTVETLAGVLTMAAACISNDSGAMHLAAAAGVPLAAIFGPTNEHETAPLPRRGRPAKVLLEAVDCRPCMLRECPIDHRCMTRLAPDRVYDVVSEMLQEYEPGRGNA